jgi:hypothetical protein
MVMKLTDGGRWKVVVLRGWERCQRRVGRPFRLVSRVTKPNPPDADAGRLPVPFRPPTPSLSRG